MQIVETMYHRFEDRTGEGILIINKATSRSTFLSNEEIDKLCEMRSR